VKREAPDYKSTYEYFIKGGEKQTHWKKVSKKLASAPQAEAGSNT
jgi:hypothetical protein